MNVLIRKYESRDIADMVKIWNSVVEDGTRMRTGWVTP